MIKLLADDIPLAPDGGFTGIGPLGEAADSDTAINRFSGIISSVIGIITVIAVIWFIFLLITGAVGIMSSGGDKAKVQAARSKITWGLVGLMVVVAGIFIIQLVGGLIGLDILNIGETIKSLVIIH